MTNKIDCDAIVVGAGFAGLALIHHLKKTGISVKVLDKASEIGGTWAWNRYPGAATDSEGYYYCLTFSKEILQEWTWSERYPGWEETNRYLNFVADKCDMWPHIQLDTEVISAEFNKEDGLWIVKTKNDEELVKEVANTLHDAIYFMTLSKKKRTSVTQKMRSFAIDLIDSKWKDKLTTHDLTLGTFGAHWLTKLKDLWGEDKWNQFVTGLAKNNPVRLVLITVSALIQKNIPLENYPKSVKKITIGSELNLSTFVKNAINSGYRRAGNVMDIGEIAVRGGIVDIYSPSYNKPIRIDFFGEEVEDLKFSDKAHDGFYRARGK